MFRGCEGAVNDLQEVQIDSVCLRGVRQVVLGGSRYIGELAGRGLRIVWTRERALVARSGLHRARVSALFESGRRRPSSSGTLGS